MAQAGRTLLSEKGGIVVKGPAAKREPNMSGLLDSSEKQRLIHTHCEDDWDDSASRVGLFERYQCP